MLLAMNASTFPLRSANNLLESKSESKSCNSIPRDFGFGQTRVKFFAIEYGNDGVPNRGVFSYLWGSISGIYFLPAMHDNMVIGRQGNIYVFIPVEIKTFFFR